MLAFLTKVRRQIARRAGIWCRRGAGVLWWFASHLLFPVLGVLAFALAWAHSAEIIPAPPRGLWLDSSAKLVGVGLLFWGMQGFFWWLDSTQPTAEEIERDHRQAQSRLRANVSSRETLVRHLEPFGIPDRDRRALVAELLDWARFSEAELWTYDRPGESIEGSGFALVHDGVVIDTRVLERPAPSHQGERPFDQSVKSP